MVDKKKHIFEYHISLADVIMQCFCGNNIQLPPIDENDRSRVTCDYCDQTWVMFMRIEPVAA